MSSSRTSADPPGGAPLEARDLVVAYGRGTKAGRGLKGFTAGFQPGITGLVGPNGAGKTTFLRAAAGLLPPSSGTLRIHGMEPAAFVAKGGIGILPESPVLPGFLRVEEFLRGLEPPPPERKAPGAGNGESPMPPWEERLGALLKKPLDALSLGQRKKVALSAVLAGGPDLLLLDEPTNGLDPRAVRDLREALLRERARGATLVISSHHLDELQRVADALVFVKEGIAVGAWSREGAMGAFGTLERLFDHLFGEE
jgi:ABC-2 type transport system ATP-binding protein